MVYFVENESKKRHTSHVTRHTSHVIRHTSHVTRHATTNLLCIVRQRVAEAEHAPLAGVRVQVDGAVQPVQGSRAQL